MTGEAPLTAVVLCICQCKVYLVVYFMKLMDCVFEEKKITDTYILKSSK